MIPLSDPRVQKYLTPWKFPDPILVGSGREGAFDSRGVDVPFVFRHNGRYCMMYTGYDGTGYQTALATSDDMIHWTHEAAILTRGGSGWDRIGASGNWILKESDDLYQVPRLKKVNGRYWMVYHAYPSVGFEEGPAEIGLAWSEDESLHTWHRLEEPVLSWRGGAPWERGGLYKACLIEAENRYYLFYNAKTDDPHWIEQTGVAVSNDMIHWEKSPLNPVLPVGEGRWDSRFASDPYVVRDGETWLMFYYGYDDLHAQDGLAISDDLMHWEKVDAPILAVGKEGALDEVHAHKPAMFYEDGTLWHFYCAVRKHREGDPTEVWNEFRTLAVASNNPDILKGV